MVNRTSNNSRDLTSKYNGSLTREQFLFYEMRITAGLMRQGMKDEDILERIVKDNLFQYPTERSIRRIGLCCLRRLSVIQDDVLVEAIALRPSEEAKQICLYAMMKDSRLVWDFMLTVVGEKYRQNDMTFGKIDLNSFFLRLQEQDDIVASWSDSTIAKLKGVFVKILVENGYLENNKAERLNPVWLYPILEHSIKNNDDDRVLPAFNCFT